MKKLLIGSHLFTLLLGTFFGLNRFSGKSNNELPGSTNAGPCARMSYDFTKWNTTGQIKIKTAVDLADSYKNDIWPKLKTPNEEMNARSIHFTLETLKNFLWQIENAACKNNCSKQPLQLGVRIYFAKYPDVKTMTRNADLSTTKSGYNLHQTLFMVPTYADNGSYYDFNPLDMGSGCSPKKLKELLTANSIVGNGNTNRNLAPNPLNQMALILTPSQMQLTYKDAYGGGNGQITSSQTIQNHGGLIPPDPEDGTAF